MRRQPGSELTTRTSTWRRAAIAGVALGWASVAVAQPRFSLEAWYWQGGLTASARVSDGGLGTVFDFKRDLGLADEDIPEGRFVWATGLHSRVRLGYLEVAYDGDVTVSRTIEFGGQTYTVGTRVVTGLEKRYVRLGWVWQFVDAGHGAFRFGTVLEAKALAIDASLAAPELDPPKSEAESRDAVLPTIGLAIDVNPHRAINLYAEASGVDAGDNRQMLDAEIGVRIYPFSNLGLLACYRRLDLRVDDKPDFAKLEIAGPFLGIAVRW